jgi:hypothetical protein
MKLGHFVQKPKGRLCKFILGANVIIDFETNYNIRPNNGPAPAKGR